MNRTYTNQRALRAAFNAAWARRCAQVPAYKTDKPARRMAFSCFIDDLERDGQITQALAQRATLAND